MLNRGKIVFVARYPDHQSKMEGMSQRMIAVDEQFANDARCFLYVSHRFFLKRQTFLISKDVVQYQCNLFVHFFFIVRLLSRSKLIYFHSVQNVLPLLPCLFFIHKKKQIILDIHGVVPEEHLLAGQSFKSKLYNFSERYLFTRLFLSISVTDAMSDHFKEKYPWTKTRWITYPIMPSNILDKDYIVRDDGLEDDRINIIYSGNLQVWQNVDLMVDVISKNLSSTVYYKILTGDPLGMKKLLMEKGLSESNNVSVDSVAPERLSEFYEKAHYGFVLRDDITVNRVACPTKVIEYMNYGIIPIVKSPHIGDFYSLNYEYINLQDFKIDRIQSRKSLRNNLIISTLKQNSEKINIRSYLLDVLI